MFASDLFKSIELQAEICFIKLASYKGSKSTGNVVIRHNVGCCLVK